MSVCIFVSTLPPSQVSSSSVVDWLSTLWQDTISSSSNHAVVMAICRTQMPRKIREKKRIIFFSVHYYVGSVTAENRKLWSVRPFVCLSVCLFRFFLTLTWLLGRIMHDFSDWLGAVPAAKRGQMVLSVLLYEMDRRPTPVIFGQK